MSSIASNAPRIAVVIPTYNRAKLISRALDSVFSSPSDDIEIIVVDDASTDETINVLAQYQDPRLTVRSLPHRSNGNVARNLGVRATKAPIIAFLDSDDEFLPGRIERLIEYFDRHPHVGAIMDAFITEFRGVRHAARLPAAIMDEASLTHLVVTHAFPMTSSAIAARRSALIAAGGLDESLFRQQDKDLMLRLATVTQVAVATGCDVVKHQISQSVSRALIDSVKGLDELIGRHSVFKRPEYDDLRAYLAARSLIKCLACGRIVLAIREALALHRSSNIEASLLSALMRYNRGRYFRRIQSKRLEDRFSGNAYLD